ncbi:MAG: ATPase domain-containing protein [Thermoplasmata archaeon]
MVERARIGIKVVDSLIEGGIPRKTSVAVQGPSGNEKYDLALSFVKEGIRKGEAVIVALSSISPEEFKRGMKAIGIDTEPLEKERMLRIIDWYSHKEKPIMDIEEDNGILRCSVDLINVGIAFSRAIAELEESPNKRAVVEILSPALNEYDLQKVYGFAQSTKAKLERIGFTSLFLVEKEMHDSVTLSTLLQPFDGVIDIERTREGDKIVRKVGALSMKNTKVDSNYVPLTVGDSGIKSDEGEGEDETIPKKIEDVSDSKDVQLWYDLGTKLLLKGDSERALKCFDKVLSLDSSHVGAWSSKANALKDLGRMDEATKCYERALESSKKTQEKPERPKAEAEEPSRKCSYCSETIPSRLKFCDNCGMSELTAKVAGMDVNRIMRVCDVKLGRNPEDVDALFVKGATYEKIGNHERAIQVLNELTHLDPRYPGVWILKAKIYARLGDVKNAAKCREMALSSFEEQGEREYQYECPVCGQGVPKDADVCDHCGARFEVAPVEVESTEEPAERVKPRRPKREDERERLRREIAGLRSRKPKLAPRTKDVPQQKEPATPADRFGLTNGLVRKSLSSIPGRTNGLTNGRAPGKTNGLTNGRGRTNGLVNGLRGRVNGLTNGLVNGRGRVNGLTYGLVNGRGRVNGFTNGLVNGFRSIKMGLTNGVTNGLGLTNGLGSGKFARETKRYKWKVFLPPLVAVFLLTVPLIMPTTIPSGAQGKIRIDAAFSDWDDVIRTEVRSDQTIDPNIDMTEVSVEDNDNYLSFFIQVRGNILQGDVQGRIADVFDIFLDVDRRSDTGYDIAGIGADFLLQIAGIEGRVDIARVSRFDPFRNPRDWNSWIVSSSVFSACSGDSLEAQVYWETLAPVPSAVDAYFHSKSWMGDEDFSDYIVSNSKGILSVTQRSLVTTDVLTGNNQPLLQFDIQALERDITLERFTIEVRGTAQPSDISYLKLVDESGTPLEQKIFLGVPVSFTHERFIEEGTSVRFVVLADIGASNSGHTIGARISDRNEIYCENGTVSLTTVASDRDLGYVGTLPTLPIADGAFVEWTNPILDQLGEESTSGNCNIDIMALSFFAWDSDAFFFLKVEARIFEGRPVMVRNPFIPLEVPRVVDSDLDSVPDDVDGPGGSGIYRFDFDNDGVPDLQENNDVDGDGIIDYALGPDMWLNTTIPVSYPPQYANQSVARYIGPVELPPEYGYDIARIYIDSDNSTLTGHPRMGIGSDYLVEVVGISNEVVSAKFMEFSGSFPGEWKWDEVSTPEAFETLNQMELSVIDSPGITNASAVGFEITDAFQNIDVNDDMSRGTRNSSEGGWLFSSPAKNGGTRASYQVDTSTSSEATAYSHQRKLIYDGTYWWAFYYNGTETVYEYSSDGQTWTNPPEKAFSTSGVKYASLWYNDTGSTKVVYVVGDNSTATSSVYVRRGTISGTTISWGTEYTVTVCHQNGPMADKVAFISQDSQGYLWIISNNRPSAGSNYNIAGVRSTNVDDVSSWGTYTDLLAANADTAYLYAIIVPLSGQDMYAIWYNEGNLEGKKYTSGTGWGSVTSIDTTTSGVTNKTVSAVVDSAYNIHLVYINETGRVNYTKYTNSWSSPTVLDTNANNEYVTITLDNSTNYLYLFYINSTHQIKGKALDFPSWVDITGIEENTDEKDWLTSVYEVDSVLKICWEWTNGTTSPYQVRFETGIPEFEDVIAPVFFLAILALMVRRKRRERRSVPRQ